MKTSVEINGYVISIEETEGVISVNAIKDEEVIEEFTIETEEGEEGEGEDVKGFGDYGDEEEDFDRDDLEDELEGQDDEEEEDDDEEESQEKSEMPGAALESFQSFINKRK
jgi:hypothetical protein